MKHKYELQQQQPIEEEPSSREGTIQVRNLVKDGGEPFSWPTFEKRIAIIKELLAAPSKQWSEIIGKWPNQEVTKVALKQGVTQMKNKSLLIGKITNGRIHGFGLMIGGCNRFYQGDFQNNCKHGMGYQAFNNGVYQGMYINNKPEGRGNYYSFDKEEYDGQFIAGKKNGFGTWKTPKETYVGEWSMDVPEGAGIIDSEVSRFEGEVKAGAKHGQGKQNFKNGDRYIGSYVNGRPDGFGEYVWSQNGAVFQGYFKNGLRHGKGKWTSNGDKYQGQYINDKKCGHGQFHWASGNYYIGEYFNDLRHGQGQMNWIDGSWYKGEWKYGIQHGSGELHQIGQLIRRGVFENNVLVNEEIDIRKEKIQKKSSSFRKSNKQMESERKLPSIQKQQERRYTASLASKLPAGIPRNNTTHNQIKATTQYISRSTKGMSQTTKNKRRHYTNRSEKRKTDRDRKDRDEDNGSIDLIQWSNIYNLKTQPTPKTKRL